MKTRTDYRATLDVIGAVINACDLKREDEKAMRERAALQTASRKR
jgi:hypothetical protein